MQQLVIIEKRSETPISTRVIDMEKSVLAAVLNLNLLFLKYMYTK